jgi:deazaflavin-dependent oxidoreductase (nitroreductase family)
VSTVVAVWKDAIFRVGTGIHRLLLRATGGRVFGRLAGMPVVLLTTTGRQTGRRRTTVLTTPVHDDGCVVLVASYGGDDRHPAWFLNLREDPAVTVEMKGRSRPMRARIATDDEKQELWPRILSAYGGYGGYQRRTGRDIPVVLLEPA